MTGQIASLGIATGAIIALLGWCIWRLFRPRATRLDHPAIFFTVLFLALLFLRLPQICWTREINVDESQMVAQAERYLSHPVPWRDVDGTTSGPLNSWLLSVPILLGAPANWATARTVLWAANCATILFVYLALRCFGTRAEAQAALMPTVLFYAFLLDPDFTHYSSETLPVLLISAIAWLLCRAWMTEKFSRATIFLTGFIAGCLPFAKLQATPLAAFLIFAALAEINYPPAKMRWQKTGWLCLGAILFPILLLGVVAACGAGGDFWNSYVLAPLAYTQMSLSRKLRLTWIFFIADTNFRGYLVSAIAGAILLAASWCCVRDPKPGRKLLVSLIAVLLFGGVEVFCLMKAGKTFEHYLLLIVPAQALFFGPVLAISRKLLEAPEESIPRAFPKPAHYFLAAFAMVISFQALKAPEYFKLTRAFLAGRKPGEKSIVAQRISEACRAGDTMSVWGWMPAYYVETGLMPATRDAIGHFITEAGPYQDYYRRRYLEDLQRSRPAIFVDAMADGVFTWIEPGSKEHESFPALNRFIEQNYSLWSTVHLITSKGPNLPVRIYLLKSCMEERHLWPEELNIELGPSFRPEPARYFFGK